MRPWLVVIGVVFLTLAAGTLAALLFAGSGNQSTATTPTTYRLSGILPNATEELPFSGSGGASEQFSLVWQATGALHVVLRQTQPCSGSCGGDPLLVAWPSNSSGDWSGSGPFHFPLLCDIQNVQSQPLNVTLSGRAVSSSPTTLSLEFEVILGAAAAGLFLVGGLAAFIGLFLRGSPFLPGPAPVRRSADDLEFEPPAREPPH